MIIRILLLLVMAFQLLPGKAVAMNVDQLAAVPILHEGRIKPLDTFARVHLLAFYGKRQFPGMTPMEWLTEVIYDAPRAYARKVFDVKSPDSLATLNLPRREGHKYSFQELFQALHEVVDDVNQWYALKPDERTPSQQELVDLYLRVLRYYEISRSFSLILPDFRVRHSELAQELGLKTNLFYNYMDLSRHRQLLSRKMKEIRDTDQSQWSELDLSWAQLARHLSRVQQDVDSAIFKIFPPQFMEGSDLWHSPWSLVSSGEGGPWTAAYLKSFEEAAEAYRHKNPKAFDRAASLILKQVQEIPQTVIDDQRLKTEYQYNRWDLFTKSLVFYLLAFLLLCLSWFGRPELLRKIGFLSMIVGAVFHIVGIALRIYIMSRPPVTTLYESIIFVAFIGVLFACVLEAVRKNGYGILIGSVMGVVLHFIGFSYADEGDTMGMLVAVLNTNFWLATHVVTITIGYGCCFVGGIVGHMYLVMSLFKNTKKEKLRELAKNMLGVSMFALFFSMFGTILGGIWADQSWGRFWGWDPKENGAMLICLWLLFLLHARLAGLIRERGYAFGMVITNIVVALAWFGVNLLNVGLHSYGFTEHIAYNLAAFCGAELLFGIVFYFWSKQKGLGT